MRFEVSTRQAAFLVVSSSHYPGWTAFVNDRHVPIHRANFVTMGVFVPAGTSDVVLRFSTPGLRVGALISALSLGSVVLLLMWAVRAGTRPREKLR